MSTLTQEERTSSLGLVRFSLEFCGAAWAAHAALTHGRGTAGHAPAPVHTMVGQSVELALKAYVRESGAGLGAMRALGHNLEKCMATAEAKGFRHAANKTHLLTLAREYGVHRFRYIETGLIDLLSPQDLFALNADILQAALQGIPESWRFLVQAAGEMLCDEGWLDLPAAKGMTGREAAIAINRSRAISRAIELSQSRRKPNLELIDPDAK
ncbi:MAG: hypothetical protein AB7G40_03340 [Hyphomonadaceae bacterium]